MWEVYFDDSATTDWVAAACYVASSTQWAEFTRGLKLLSASEGFTDFHMTDLAAGGGEFRDWSKLKRSRVYSAMAALIRSNVEHGFALAFRKSDYDTYIPEYIKKDLGYQHYPVGVDFLMGKFMEWRIKDPNRESVQYIFDRSPKGKNIRTEIQRIEDNIRQVPGEIERFGLSEDGFSEQSKSVFIPLQAADVLAWQWSHFIVAERGTEGTGDFYDRSQMAELFEAGRYECGWIEGENFRKWAEDVYAHESEGATSAFLASRPVDSRKKL